MNEGLFFLHVTVAILFALVALRLGKEALISWIALQAVLANLFVIKQTTLFSFHVTCSDVFAVGSYLGFNLLREYFGKESAKQALIASLFATLFFLAMGKIHLLYTPSPHDTTQAAFQTLLAHTPRILLASIVVFCLVQQVNVRLFEGLKTRFPSLPLTVRNTLCVGLTQSLDSCLFSSLGLWGLVESLTDVIAISITVKVCALLCLSPITLFAKRFLSTSRS